MLISNFVLFGDVIGFLPISTYCKHLIVFEATSWQAALVVNDKGPITLTFAFANPRHHAGPKLYGELLGKNPVLAVQGANDSLAALEPVDLDR